MGTPGTAAVLAPRLYPATPACSPARQIGIPRSQLRSARGHCEVARRSSYLVAAGGHCVEGVVIRSLLVTMTALTTISLSLFTSPAHGFLLSTLGVCLRKVAVVVESGVVVLWCWSGAEAS